MKKAEVEAFKNEIRIITACLFTLTFIVTAVALTYSAVIMIPFVLAFFLTYIITPLVDSLQVRFKWPRWLALLTAFFASSLVLFLFGLVITAATQNIIETVGFYQKRVQVLVAEWVPVFEKFGIQLDKKNLMEGVKELPIFGLIQNVAGLLISFLSNFFIIVVFVIFLMTGRTAIADRPGIYGQIDKKIKGYLVTKFATSAFTGICVGIALVFLGVDLAVLFGLLTFFLNFIPTFGSIIATLLPLPIALLQFDNYLMVLWVGLIPGAIQFAIGSVVEPKLLGQSLDLHPAAVLLSLMFWGLIWGVTGMLLALPITAVMKIVFERFEVTSGVAKVLAGKLP